jgi:hypothetical protein
MTNTVKTYIVRISMFATAAAAVLGGAAAVTTATAAADDLHWSVVADGTCPSDMHWSIPLQLCVAGVPDDMHW